MDKRKVEGLQHDIAAKRRLIQDNYTIIKYLQREIDALEASNIFITNEVDELERELFRGRHG
jgi:hypothetical protein